MALVATINLWYDIYKSISACDCNKLKLEDRHFPVDFSE